MAFNYNHKIDPYLRSTVKASSDKMLKVILYARQYEKCVPFLNELGITVAAELPFIEGYIVEIPTSLLPKLARCKNFKYIAADVDIKACI